MYDNASLEKPEVLIQQLEAGKAYIATVTALNKKVILSSSSSSPSSSPSSSLFLSSTSSYFILSGSKSLSAQNGRNTAAAGAPACRGEDRGDAADDGEDADNADDGGDDADDNGESAGADSARLQLCECKFEKGPSSFPFKDAKGNFLRNYKQMQCSAYQHYAENQPELCTLYGKQIFSVCENMAACNILTFVYSR